MICQSWQQNGIHCQTERTTSAGQRTWSEFRARYDGQEYAVTGSAEFTGVALEHQNAHTIRGRFLKDGKAVVAYRIVVSPGGKHLTITSIDPRNGADLNSVVVYERAAARP